MGSREPPRASSTRSGQSPPEDHRSLVQESGPATPGPPRFAKITRAGKKRSNRLVLRILLKSASEFQRMSPRNDAEVIRQLQPRFAIEVHVRSGLAGDRRLSDLQVRLIYHRREIKGSASPLDAGFIDHITCQQRGVAGYQRLIENVVIPPRRRSR